eukprot:gene11326-23704_t
MRSLCSSSTKETNQILRGRYRRFQIRMEQSRNIPSSKFVNNMFHQADIILAALGGATAASILYCLYYIKEISGTNEFRNYKRQLIDAPACIPNEIRNELYSRVNSFFGDEKFSMLHNSFVIIVGLGGVGSHATNMLIRSGVTKIKLIDFDQVTLSSLNRHAFANLEDVGIPKVEAVKRHILKIIPWCQVEAVTEMFKGTESTRLLEGNPDYVLDCIDDVNTKAELIAYCIQNNIKVLTSTGAGGKADPTRIRIGLLNDCIKDPLATKMKWKLKKHHINPSLVTTIYSVEKPLCNLLPLTEEQASAPSEFGTVDYIRLRVMPVLGTSPAMFGQAMASYVLCQLANAPYLPDSCDHMSKNQKSKMLQYFLSNEIRRFSDENVFENNLDEDDMEFVVQQ